ncbi:uncharacterized protein [Penaeus vannamei]|uniref:uncharacterized protein n=1 Tax=Penaeus vannamei TaxID=6689 RepID=UPI00387F417E
MCRKRTQKACVRVYTARLSDNMKVCGGGLPMWLLTLVLAAAATGARACRVNDYVFSCILDILEEHIIANAQVNYCHLPVDITFRVNHQYGKGKSHSWKYTFVTTNQNERVLIPGLQLPSAPHAPVYLYVRVPERDFSMHNTSFVSIEASFVAELKNNEWEEAEFINHTIYIRSTEDCRFSSSGQDPIPWIIGCLFAIIFVCGGIGGGCYLYRRKKMAVDQLALVNAMEVGLPGAQPYQMGTVENKSDKTPGDSERKTDKEENVSKENKGKQATVEEDEDEMSGKKGFKFNRLKEEKPEMPKNYARGIDNSVIIGNPAYLEETDQVQNKGSSGEEYVNRNQVDQNNHNIPRNDAYKVSTEISSQNLRQMDPGEDCYENDVTDNGPKVCPDEMEPSQLSDDSSDSSLQVGQGARPKVRGVAASITGSTTVADASDGHTESQKCL